MSVPCTHYANRIVNRELFRQNTRLTYTCILYANTLGQNISKYQTKIVSSWHHREGKSELPWYAHTCLTSHRRASYYQRPRHRRRRFGRCTHWLRAACTRRRTLRAVRSVTSTAAPAENKDAGHRFLHDRPSFHLVAGRPRGYQKRQNAIIFLLFPLLPLLLLLLDVEKSRCAPQRLPW